MANDGKALQAGLINPSITWVGHATLLVQMNGVNALTDPQWSERASPVSWGGPRRLSAPGLAFEDLPPIQRWLNRILALGMNRARVRGIE